MKNKKKRSFLIWAFYSTIILLLVIAAISNIIRKSATNSGADNIQSSIELLILIVPAVISALNHLPPTTQYDWLVAVIFSACLFCGPSFRPIFTAAGC